MNRPRQVVDLEHGKRAITEYRILRTFEDGSQFLRPFDSKRPKVERFTLQSSLFTLLALWPHTGRTHQLRIHCAHESGLGCPILGDELYGTKADRLYLQAQAISFVHPITGRKMHFELPSDFDHIIQSSHII